MKIRYSAFLIILTFLCATGQTYAQYETIKGQVKITQGESASVPKFRMNQMIGADSSGIYLVGEKNEKPHLVRFSSDLKYENEARLEFDLNPGHGLEIVRYLLKDGRLFVFYEEHRTSDSQKTFELYIQEFDVNTLQRAGKPARLCMTMTKKRIFYVNSEMEYFFPENVSEFVVAYQDTIDKELRQINFDVFDYSGSKLRSLETLPEIKNMGYLMDIKLGSYGTLYMAYGYDYLYVFDANGNLESKIAMELPKIKLANRGELLMDDKNNKYFTYITFNPDKERVVGFVNHKIDNQERTETNVISVDQEYVMLHQDRPEVRKSEADLKKYGQPALPSLRFLNKKLLPDGSMMLAFENYIRVKMVYRDGRSFYYEETYGDIHVIKIDPSGVLEWMRKIPKLQTPGVGNRLASAFVHWTEDETFIIMSDNPANNKDMTGEIPEPYTRNSKDMTLVHISADGKVNRNALFSKGDELKLFPRARWIVEDNGRLIMPLIGSKYLQLIAFEVD